MPVLNLFGTTFADEGAAGAKPFSFLVTRDGDLSQASEASYFVWHETTAPTDFASGTSGKVVFAAGESQKVIAVQVAGDTLVEKDEAFHVALYDAVGATIGQNDALGIVRNDDTTADAQPSIDSVGLSVEEYKIPTGAARDSDVIKLTAADGVDDLRVEGRAVITDGVFSPLSFKTPLGATISFTSYDAASTTLSVSYSLETGIDHTGGQPSSAAFPNVRVKADRLSLELTDKDGDVARGLINASVYDDLPSAQNDSDTVTVGGLAATGNVITDAAAGDAGDGDSGADRAGADTPLRVTAVRNGPVEDTTLDADGNFVSTGRFGTLSIKADGSYSYVLNSNPENGVTDSFGYTVTDADGSIWTASLSIQVQGGQNAQGQAIRGAQPGDTLTGGSGADTLYASQGPDQLTGGGGADYFAFEALPWRAGVVTDFADGSDKIDLRALYQASGYTGSDAVADRYVSFERDGAGGTKVMYDTDGAGSGQAWSYHITTLQGVAASSLSNADLVDGSTGGSIDAQPRIAPGQAFAGSAKFTEQHLPNGTAQDASKLTHSGTVAITSPDGFKNIVVGGHEVVRDGAFAPSAYTTAGGQNFAFTAFNAATGELSYTYTLQAPMQQQQTGSGVPTAADRPLIVVTDNDGDTAQNVFSFLVEDDKPIYGVDHTNVAAGSTTPLTGNLLANDKPGADGWNGFNVLHPSSTATAPDAEGYRTLQGAYGTLRFQADGDYIYTLNASAPAGSVERFSYGAPDADGSRHPGPSGMPFEITITAGTGGGTAGQVITSPAPGSTVTGTAGADTINASQGPDQLTGAGGADRFVFAKPPWNAGVITDFAAGSDKIDVSALLDAYSGTNPVADGWLRLDNDAGSTKVYVDIDGAGGEWPFLITTLQGVAPSGVSLSDFVI